MLCPEREWLTKAYESANTAIEQLAKDYDENQQDGNSNAILGAIIAAREVRAETLSALEAHEHEHGCNGKQSSKARAPALILPADPRTAEQPTDSIPTSALPPSSSGNPAP